MKRLLSAAALCLIASIVRADTLRMAVTTSFHNSGLAEVLLPEIAQDIGLEVELLVVGTGQALRLGQAGDVDALLVHSRPDEEDFVAAGLASRRTEIMYNDFVILGPAADPANVAAATSAVDGLVRIARAKTAFVSRGDDSGTHKRELRLWSGTPYDPKTFDTWYKSVGAGMGAALNTAAGLSAYLISDRASWLNFRNKGELKLLFSGDPHLFNQYAYLPISAARHPHVRADLADRLETWLTSPKAVALINGFRINDAQLFVFGTVGDYVSDIHSNPNGSCAQTVASSHGSGSALPCIEPF